MNYIVKDYNQFYPLGFELLDFMHSMGLDYLLPKTLGWTEDQIKDMKLSYMGVEPNDVKLVEGSLFYKEMECKTCTAYFKPQEMDSRNYYGIFALILQPNVESTEPIKD